MQATPSSASSMAYAAGRDSGSAEVCDEGARSGSRLRLAAWIEESLELLGSQELPLEA